MKNEESLYFAPLPIKELKQVLNNRKQVVLLIEAQILVILVWAFVLFWISPTVAYSAFIGGLICILGNAYLAYKLFKRVGARAAQEIIGSFYSGEFGKLIIITLLFGVVFKWVRPISPLALFSGYLVTQGVFWVSPFILKNRR